MAAPVLLTFASALKTSLRPFSYRLAASAQPGSATMELARFDTGSPEGGAGSQDVSCGVYPGGGAWSHRSSSHSARRSPEDLAPARLAGRGARLGLRPSRAVGEAAVLGGAVDEGLQRRLHAEGRPPFVAGAGEGPEGPVLVDEQVRGVPVVVLDRVPVGGVVPVLQAERHLPQEADDRQGLLPGERLQPGVRVLDAGVGALGEVQVAAFGRHECGGEPLGRADRFVHRALVAPRPNTFTPGPLPLGRGMLYCTATLRPFFPLHRYSVVARSMRR